MEHTVAVRTRKRHDKLCACAMALFAKRLCAENRTFNRLLIRAVCFDEHICRRAQRQMEQKENDARMRPARRAMYRIGFAFD